MGNHRKMTSVTNRPVPVEPQLSTKFKKPSIFTRRFIIGAALVLSAAAIGAIIHFTRPPKQEFDRHKEAATKIETNIKEPNASEKFIYEIDRTIIKAKSSGYDDIVTASERIKTELAGLSESAKTELIRTRYTYDYYRLRFELTKRDLIQLGMTESEELKFTPDKGMVFTFKSRDAGEKDLYALVDAQKFEDAYLFLKMKDRSNGKITELWIDIGTTSIGQNSSSDITNEFVKNAGIEEFSYARAAGIKILINEIALPMIFHYYRLASVIEADVYHYHPVIYGLDGSPVSPPDVKMLTIIPDLELILPEFKGITLRSIVVNYDGAYTTGGVTPESYDAALMILKSRTSEGKRMHWPTQRGDKFVKAIGELGITASFEPRVIE